MAANFQLFGVTHLGILLSVVLLAAGLAVVERRLAPGGKGLRLGLAAVLALDTVAWDGFLAWHGQLTFPAHLPVEFCDATLYVTLIALFTLRPAFLDLAYYWALAGTSMALLTPDLWERFPSLSTVQFFVGHGLVVMAVLYLVWSRQARPRKGSVARAMLGVNAWAAFDGAFDRIFKTNYMYLRAKPGHASLLDLLGPWPWYIAATEGVALGLFLLLYLPFWRSATPSQRQKQDRREGEAPALGA
ncbi:MAG: TIGR02206 family membrane protein [Terracidiphilus sp.]